MAKFGDLPAGDGTTLGVILKESGQEKFYLDGTVHPVQRSIDYELQKIHYTGKQCTHVVKNDLLNDKNRRVWWISDTYEGSVHDKKVMDLENCKFPKGITLVYDSKRCPQAFKVYSMRELVFYNLIKHKEMLR